MDDGNLNNNSNEYDTINHTYLRYECADTFGITCTSSSTVSSSHQVLSTTIITNGSNNKSTTTNVVLCYTIAGSVINVWNLYNNIHTPIYKIGHVSTSNIGCGYALNDNDITCIDVYTNNNNNNNNSNTTDVVLIAAGYVDGTIRIFEFDPSIVLSSSSNNNHNNSSSSSNSKGYNTLLDSSDNNSNNSESSNPSKMLWYNSNPLVLQQATTSINSNTSPIRYITFDRNSNSPTTSPTTRLASGSSNGTIILWDIINECGLYRFIGHSNHITELIFVQTGSNNNNSSTTTSTRSNSNDYLISSSADGLIKVWDIINQCCIQTITKYRTSTNHNSSKDMNYHINFSIVSDYQQQRQRLITSSSSSSSSCIGMVWNIGTQHTTTTTDGKDTKIVELDNTKNTTSNSDDICTFMGLLKLPPNVIENNSVGSTSSNSNNKFSCIQYYRSNTNNNTTTYIGILRTTTSTQNHHIDIYRFLSITESYKKRQRRIKRRNEKIKKKSNQDSDSNTSKGTTTKKRGILDDDDDNDNDNNHHDNDDNDSKLFDPDQIQVTDEYEYITSIVTTPSTKVRSFRFIPTIVPSSNTKNKGLSYNNKGNNKNVQSHEICRILCANCNNTMDLYSIQQQQQYTSDTNHNKVTEIDDQQQYVTYVAEKVYNIDHYGHTTGIRNLALSNTSTLCCTISKNHIKVWNVPSRSCIASIPLVRSSSSNNKSLQSTKKSTGNNYYGLCCIFLPGNAQQYVVVGTREGDLLIIDIHSNEIIFIEPNAHNDAIWSLDIIQQQPQHMASSAATSPVMLISGSADKLVKFWTIVESSSQQLQLIDDSNAYNNDETSRSIMLRHTRTLQMTDDVVAARYSYSTDPTRRMIFVATLDCTIKVFFDDTLKMFLSLYGHKLPVLAIDCSDDDTILASGSADKTIKIWGLDFGDTHRTLHGHNDSITDLRFVRRTHNFFTSSKDGTVRYWDGDRFEQILLLNGHTAEVNCLAVSRTGAFVLSGGMDRQVRVWERTKDIVFLQEERERELERVFDRVNNRDEGGTGRILDRKQGNDNNDDDNDDGMHDENEPQSEAAARQSVLSVACGDRIMEALERADQELKDIAMFRKAHGTEKKRSPNLIMLGLEPAPYILWVLRTIKSAEIEQSLILLSLRHIERMMYYLIQLLKTGQGTELCSRVAVFLVKAHQNQIIVNKTMIPPLRELKRLVRIRLAEARDVAGFDIAALKFIAKISNEKKQQMTFFGSEQDASSKDVWAGLGLGSDVAAALEGRGRRQR